MFVWLKLLGVEDSLELIKTDAVAEKVLLVPGAAFSVGGPSGYVRAAYSTASPDDMEEAMVRLARLLRRNALK
jgi:kynurenine/2-aminoadipate aminotransferase